MARDIVEGPSVQLIETLAERIAAGVLQDHSAVEAVKVKVAKPHVRLGDTVLAGSAVEILRRREAELSGSGLQDPFRTHPATPNRAGWPCVLTYDVEASLAAGGKIGRTAPLVTDRLTDPALPDADVFAPGRSALDSVARLPAAPEELQVVSSDDEERLERLTRVCVDDVITAFGLGGVSRGRAVLEALSRVPVRRLARQVLAFDRTVGESGPRNGWRVGARRGCAANARVEGRSNVPRGGPLLLVSNHPGLADAVALFASTPREDLRVIAADRPFLDALPNTSRYLLTVAEDSGGRSGIVRAAARHLRGGGAVLTFPGGTIEPDPAVLPGAVESLGRWSSSADLFARLAPDLAVVPVVVERRDLSQGPAHPPDPPAPPQTRP